MVGKPVTLLGIILGDQLSDKLTLQPTKNHARDHVFAPFAKNVQPHPNHEKTSDKPKLKNILQNKAVFFRSVKEKTLKPGVSGSHL
jgi:hypothetical protein